MLVMPRIQPDSLMTLEAYARNRKEFRAKVMAHKKDRSVALGDHVTLIFEAEGIADELGAYNPMIPDGSNWKATFMVEFPDIEERRVALARLIGIEDRVWVQVSGHDRVFAIADEDLERENAEKTSAVHFVRFELTPAMVAAVKAGAAISIGIDHENYRYGIEPVQPAVRDSLAADLA